MNSLKERYQGYIIKIYSEQFLNNKTEFQKLQAWKELVNQARHKFAAYKRWEFNSPADRLIDSVTEVCDRAMILIDNLMLFRENRLSEKIISREQFIKQLSNITIDHSNEELVFQHKLAGYYFDKPFIRLSSFKLHRYSKLFFDVRSFGEIASSIYVPVSIKNPRQPEICSKAIDLPFFFYFKGKI